MYTYYNICLVRLHFLFLQHFHMYHPLSVFSVLGGRCDLATFPHVRCSLFVPDGCLIGRLCLSRSLICHLASADFRSLGMYLDFCCNIMLKGSLQRSSKNCREPFSMKDSIDIVVVRCKKQNELVGSPGSTTFSHTASCGHNADAATAFPE